MSGLFDFVYCVALLGLHGLCLLRDPLRLASSVRLPGCLPTVHGRINCFDFQSWLQEKPLSLDFLPKSVATQNADLLHNVFRLKYCTKCWQSQGEVLWEHPAGRCGSWACGCGSMREEGWGSIGHQEEKDWRQCPWGPKRINQTQREGALVWPFVTDTEKDCHSVEFMAAGGSF